MTDIQTPPPPWSLAPLVAVVAQIRALDPQADLIEGGYPFQRLPFADPGHSWLLPPPQRAQAMHSFFSGFSINEASLAEADLAALAAASRQAGQSPWLMIGADQAAVLETRLTASGVPLLVHAATEDALDALASEAAAAGLHHLRFVDAADDWAGYSAFLPTGLAAQLGAGTEAVIATDLPPATIRINPRDMVSDCPWAAEGDVGYSWIWTGPEICHRICLGHLPQDARALDVHFLENPNHEGIADSLMFQVNGRRVAADTSQLSTHSGTVQVVLPAGLDTPVVLGVCAFPDSDKPEDDARHIRVAIEAMDILT